MNKRLTDLGDWSLAQELRHAQRQEVACLSALAGQRRNISEDGANALASAAWDAQAYVRDCVEEIERRKQRGDWNPDMKEIFRPVTSFLNSLNGGNTSEKSIRPKSITPAAHPEAEGPPFIVIEDGMPRPWRDGDLIHDRFMRKK